MKTYQKPTIRVKSIVGEHDLMADSGSDLVTPIDNENPATGPANAKGMLDEFPDEENKGNLYQPWGQE